MAYISIDSIDYSGNKFNRNCDAIDRMLELNPVIASDHSVQLNRVDVPIEWKREFTRYTGFGASSVAKELWDSSHGVDSRNHSMSLDERRLSFYHPRLRSKLSLDQLDALRHSSLNAHYTPVDVWRRIWSHLEALGLKSHLESVGNGMPVQLLEPSAGVGTAVSTMPEWLKDRCDSGSAKWTCVELEVFTAKMCKCIHSDATVYGCGVQEAPLPHGAFDLIVSNVPFGDYGVSDDTIDARFRKPIHDYFFAKAMQLVKVGGIVAFVTSHYSFNKLESRFRRYMAKHSNLLDLVMLPSSTFKASAGTEVVTCVAFFQRVPTRIDVSVANDSDTRVDSIASEYESLTSRQRRGKYGYEVRDGETAAVASGVDTSDATLPPWCSVDSRSVKHHWRDVNLQVSRWFSAHPERVFGTIDASSTMYGRGSSLNVVSDRDAALAAWDSLIARVPSETRMQSWQEMRVSHNAIASSVTIDSIVTSVEGATEDPRYHGLMRIFESMKALLTAQQEGHEYQERQQELNAAYDTFVFQFGPLTKPLKRGKTNLSVLGDSGEAQMLAALETEEFRKAPIFSKRVVGYDAAPDATSPDEAMYQSLDRFGRINLDWMAQVLRMSREDILESLGNSVFHVHPGWNGDSEALVDRDSVVPADEYLSGDIGERLVAARRWAALVPSVYARNVAALESVLPAPVPAAEIMVRLGTPWVPCDVVAAFATWLYGVKDPIVRHANDDWYVWATNGHESGWTLPEGVIPESLGTTRVGDHAILIHALNGTTPIVMDKDSDGNEYKNVAETTLASACVRELQRVFKMWVWTDDARTKRLEGIYNSLYNSCVPRRFNGSHLRFPGLNATFVPRWYQRAAVARIMSVKGGTADQVCITHKVGYGKTASAIIAARKLQQIGAVGRVLFVVKKSLRVTWRNALANLYPSYLDRVRFCEGDDFGKGRTRFTADIVSGKYDTIVATYEQFQKFPLAPETVQLFVNETKNDIESQMLEAKESGLDNRSVKQFEKTFAKAVTKVLEASRKVKRDTRDYLTLEQLGIGMIVLDEAQQLKRGLIFTKQTGVKGINLTVSQRAIDAQMKAEWALKHKCRWVELTGTPVSNSLVEAFIVQRRLQPEMLKRKRIATFDSWAGVFTEPYDSLERTVTGEHAVARRLVFDNLPELNQMLGESWDRVATVDAIQSGDTDASNGLKIPEIHGGAVEVIETVATRELCDFTRSLAERKKSLKSDKMKKDNHLKIDGDGRKSAYLNGDPSNGWSADRVTKVDALVERVWQYYQVYSADRGVQAIFCDLFTPSTCAPLASYASEGALFKVEGLYGVIRKRLVDRGVPESDIVYIHDAEDDDESEELEEQLNCGDKRIIIGSTGKMGEGRNIQQQLVALHHLDCPWRPSDLEQRNGRILRHGNKYSRVHICAYVTQQSYDIVAWQIVRAKARFLQQISANAVSQRRSEDVGDIVITAEVAMALAAGDQRIVIRAERENQLRLLTLQYAEAQQNRERVLTQMATLPHSLDSAKRAHRAAAALAAECARVTSEANGSIAVVAQSFGWMGATPQTLYAAFANDCFTGVTRKNGNLHARVSPDSMDSARLVLLLTDATTGHTVKHVTRKKPHEAYEFLESLLNVAKEDMAYYASRIQSLTREIESLVLPATMESWVHLDTARHVYREYLQLCVDLETLPDIESHAFATDATVALLAELQEIRLRKERAEAEALRDAVLRGAEEDQKDQE